MEINKILQADYLDLLFDNRNKSYGSYELRKHYQSRAVKALGMMLSLLALAVGIPYLTGGRGKAAALETVKQTTGVVMTEFILPEKKFIPPPAPPAETHHASVAKTIQLTTPEVVDNSKVPPVKPPEIREPETAIAGAANNEGNGGLHAATTTTPPPGPPGGNNNTVMEPTATAPVKEAIAASVDVMPEYPGGMAALLAYLQNNIRYPAEAKQNGVQGKVIVRFVVNAQGRIEGAEIQRGIGSGCDKEALRVVNAMKSWKPGQVKGKAVKAYYTLPITFKLDQ